MSVSNVLSCLHNQQNQLIESLYQSAVEPEYWNHFMQNLITALDARSARLLFMNQTADKVHTSLKVNIDDSFHQQYVDYYVNACPWRPELASKPAGRMYSTFLDFSCSQKKYRGTEFYNDWARLQGIEHGICGTVIQDGQATVQFLVQRTTGPGHFTYGETGFVNQNLLPHMRAAITLARQLQLKLQCSEAIEQARNHSPMPFVLLDQRLRVIYFSEASQDLLLKYGVRIQADRLVCDQPEAHDLLQHVMRKTLNGMKAQWQEVGGQTVVRNERGTLELMCLPLHPIVGEYSFWKQGMAVVFLNEQQSWMSLNRLWVQEKFNLTHTEFNLVEALINGVSLQAFADGQGSSIHTVRSQCKSVLRKTDCSRQAALMRVMLPYLSM